MFSICSAMAFASKMPTQIGNTRWPSLSRRITIGMLVMGSTINPLMVISICMALQPRRRTRACQTRRRQIARARGAAPHAVRAGALDPDPDRSTNPCRRPGQVDDDIAAGASRQLRLAPPARRVDEHVDVGADERMVETGLNLALQPLQQHDPPRFLGVGDIVRQPL